MFYAFCVGQEPELRPDGGEFLKGQIGPLCFCGGIFDRSVAALTRMAFCKDFGPTGTWSGREGAFSRSGFGTRKAKTLS